MHDKIGDELTNSIGIGALVRILKRKGIITKEEYNTEIMRLEKIVRDKRNMRQLVEVLDIFREDVPT